MAYTVRDDQTAVNYPGLQSLLGCQREGDQVTSELGQELRNVRRTLGRSLKAAATPAGISATYLQKLETGEVKNPSPNVLYGLSETLNVPYPYLMELAGYVVPDRGEIAANPFEHALSASDLTAEERSAVAAFIGFLRAGREPEQGE